MDNAEILARRWKYLYPVKAAAMKRQGVDLVKVAEGRIATAREEMKLRLTKLNDESREKYTDAEELEAAFVRNKRNVMSAMERQLKYL